MNVFRPLQNIGPGDSIPALVACKRHVRMTVLSSQ